MSAPDRDPARVREAHAIRDAAAASSTLTELRARPDWPAWAARLDALLALVRHHDGRASAAPADDRVRVAHWNLEHGNHYDAIADALTSHPSLAGADLVSLNEADLGMARSGNRDVVGDLAARLGRHAVWAPLFLESTRGRDDDALNAIADDNAESLFGLGLLSRWPLESVRLIPLPGPEEVLFDRERMLGRFVALVARVAHPRTPFTAVTVHLEVHRTRAHRAEQMRAVLAALANAPGPVVIAGDWNTHTFDRGTTHAVPAAAVALLAWPEGALARRFRRADRGTHRETLFDALAAAGFAWEACNDFEPSLGMRFSRLGEVHALPAPLRALASHGLAWAERRARLRLDWIAERGFAHAGEALTVTGLDGPERASDHAPIVATLRLP